MNGVQDNPWTPPLEDPPSRVGSGIRGVCTPLTEVSGRVGLRSARRGDLIMYQPQGQNLANVVFALLHRDSGTPCHLISVFLPSAENSFGLGSNPPL